jgi:hypothetical protein
MTRAPAAFSACAEASGACWRMGYLCCVCPAVLPSVQELNMEVADLLAHPTFMGVSLMQVCVHR